MNSRNKVDQLNCAPVNDFIKKKIELYNELLELEKERPLTLQEEVEGLVNIEAVLAIEKILKLEKEFPGIIKVRMLDHLEILADSARIGKYPLNNWLEPNGTKADRDTNYRSIFGHCLQAYAGKNDRDGGRFAALYAACRLMMDHTRRSKGVSHELDHDIYNYIPESKL